MTMLVGLAVGIGGGVAMGEGLRSSGAYAIWKRLYLKFGEGAADQLARQAITQGTPYEEYSLSTTPSYYSDTIQLTLRGQAQPTRYRRMWLDPATQAQNFETAEGGVVRDRFPFYYTPHRRKYTCWSSGDPANSYHYTISADTQFWVRETIVKSTPGYEVLFHPVKWQFGLKLIAATCQDLRDPYPVDELGWGSMPRGQRLTSQPYFENCDVSHFIAWYDTDK